MLTYSKPFAGGPSYDPSDWVLRVGAFDVSAASVVQGPAGTLTVTAAPAGVPAWVRYNGPPPLMTSIDGDVLFSFLETLPFP